MDFVALISGGKDSCYNIWKCQQYGHRLVCLANLQSPQNDSENEEINSFMYQSAGSSVIPAYAECLQVPLLRRVIQGKAVSQTLYYENEVTGDEVEDLYELLKDVKQQFPTITAVSCGAIVSNYQRHRVENICQRLGWTCLSYLWQRDRNELIHEIVEKANIHAILIKVAGAGLDPNKHLKRPLKDLLPTLNLYHNKYGLDVCGEGGEYESLVLDAPFFLKKIEIIDTSIIYDDEDPSVGMLKILSWKIVDKDIASLPINNNPPVIPFPPAPTLPITTSLSKTPYQLLSLRSNSAITIAKNGFGQTGLIYPRLIDYERTNDLVIEQVEDILEQLKCLFSLHNIHFLDSLFIHLYISDMSLFNIVNNKYCRYFEQYPPSRCCVQAVLPDGVYVALYSTFQKNSYSLMKDEKRLDVREVVHVRSMSEWAPLCIGPYSQSNRINNSLVFVAGQIPLDPARMQLTHAATPQNDSLYLLQDIYLSLRHINNILDVNKSNVNHLMFMIIYVNNDRVGEGMKELEELFRQAYNHLLSQLRNDQGEKADPRDEDYSEEEQDEVAPDNSPPIVREVPFPLMIVRVPGLPRNASIELESIGCVEKTLPDNGWISKKETFTAEDFRNREIFNPLQLPPNLSCNNQLFSIESSSLYYPRCLSSHALQLVLSDSENLVYDERVLVEGLMLQLKMCCKEAGVKDGSFISITIFYDILLFGKESLQNILYFYFGKYGFSMDSVSLVLIPIGHSFQFSERRPLQLLMNNVDFEQIETESWIYNNNN